MSGSRANRPLTRVVALLGVLACWLGFAVLTAAPASAHAEILTSTPVDGSRLTTMPALVTLRLSENVGIQQGSLQILDQRGERVDDDHVVQPGAEAEVIGIRVRPGLGDGSYRVNYAFVSADSHPVHGGFAFVVGTGPLLNSTGAVSGSSGTDPLVDVLFTGFRWASFGGAMLMGGLVFALFCRTGARTDPRARRLVLVGCGVSAVAAIAALLLQGPYGAGRGLAEVFSGPLLATTLGASYGKLLVLRAGVVLALAWLAKRLLVPTDDLPDRLRSRYENVAAVAGFVTLLTFSAAGHAITDSIPFVSISADLCHFAALTVWLGGLSQLSLCLFRRRPEADLQQTLARFSPLAATAVGVVSVSGVVLGLLVVPSISALWTSTYGVLLCLKLLGFAALLAVANASRKAVLRRTDTPTTEAAGAVGTLATVTPRVTPRMTPRVTPRVLRRAVATELAISTVVLLLAAILSSTAPPV
ncbi:copper resistance CopC/CopD family protein [Amycolatopsis sp. H20-H5]|uniref:copper resistance CopC/CopD family protein n=1 Tax=Amycolatopsis sp. H20-H5 TaxID=3046309 RepID=UPI002DBF8BCF|nr:copper resistance protein CopC [Amycolatopsis sp. H20-H5]MEC3981492.1 copper resistance protein CopC [Amycolatopsis sp. H20-H5]